MRACARASPLYRILSSGALLVKAGSAHSFGVHVTPRQPEEQERAEHALYMAAFKLAALASILITGAGLVWASDLSSFWEIERLQATVASAGVWAPLLYMGLFALSVVFALPATAITLVGAAIFEPVSAYFIILGGAMLGAAVSFGLGRMLGRDFVKQVLGARQSGALWERLHRWDEALERRGFATMTYLRLGHLPYFLPSYLGSLTRMSWRDYLLGTLVGSIPNTFVFVFLGDVLRRAWEQGSVEALWSWRAMLAVILVLVSAALPLVLARLGREPPSASR